MAEPNEAARLPRDGNGNPVPVAYRVTTGTVTLGSGTNADDVTLPKGALAIEFWSTVAFGFLGVGESAGTEVDCIASRVYQVGCAGTDGTWKAFFDQGSGGAGTVHYIIHMGATNE